VGTPDYYLDTDGKTMPMSAVYSARVPLVNGSTKMNFDKLTTLLLKINEDPFMKSIVVGLDVENDGNITMRLRKHNFKVLLGNTEAIEKKFQNFKAFYQKTKRDGSLDGYDLVKLQFESQVIATKR
jgi:cell division protein FtsQ